ncbi:MAG: family 16 glycosylhydrolase [Candidatus Eremiobacteraeota bacterium]|nr:family 16 glycosylhydrolase [Candidatus Eremiobacteraeota bacterium]
MKVHKGISFKVILVSLLIVACSCQLPAAEILKRITVKGKVSCQGRGIPRVLMTDGEITALTDKNGEYSLQSSSNRRFIYYTLPSGYESPVEKGLPVFYKRIDNEKGEVCARNFELLKSRRNQEDHAFIVVADPQVIESSELDLLASVVRDIKDTVSGFDPSVPVHGICCGDMVFDRPNLFDPYIATMSGAGIPFYHGIGNHDMDYSNKTHETSSCTYESRFGPPYYSFNRGKIHYITLNDVFYYGYSYHYMGYLDQKQLDWLAADLKQVPKNATIAVSLHIPTRYNESEAKPGLEGFQKNALVNAQALYDLFKGYKVHIMAGHSHTQWKTIISGNIMEHTNAAASAAWWQGEIGLDGTPQGYTVYEADGDKLTWYFKGVNKSRMHQFTLYPAGSDAKYPCSFIANVFNHDPLWKVYWLENGVNKGEMEQYWGEDPEAGKLYPPGGNKKYSWLSAGETHHLFKAEPTEQDADVSVMVVDRFGTAYTQHLSSKAPPAAPELPAAPVKRKWKMVWSDEFNAPDGSLPDPAKWCFDVGGHGFGNHQLEYDTARPENTIIHKGNLVITACREKYTGPDGVTRDYTSARLKSDKLYSQKYGRIEARIKLPEGQGMWPAFWMLGNDIDQAGWPSCGEIDIMENVGNKPSSAYGTIHGPGYSGSKGISREFILPSGRKFSDDYHVFSVEWEPDSIRFSVDGKGYHTVSRASLPEGARWVYDHPFFLLVNLAVGGDWPGPPEETTRFPQKMLVDWIRAYEAAGE